MKFAKHRDVHLYVLMALGQDGVAFFKVGISTDLLGRLKTVQTGCPVPIREMVHVKMAGPDAAREAERHMHQRLSAFRSAGEWFQFDLADASHKQAFNSASREVLTPVLGSNWRWTRLKLESGLALAALDRYWGEAARVKRTPCV